MLVPPTYKMLDDGGFIVPPEIQPAMEAALACDEPIFREIRVNFQPGVVIYPEVENRPIKYNIELKTYDNRRIVRSVK